MNELTFLTRDQIDKAVKSLPAITDVYEEARQLKIRSEKTYVGGIELKNGIKAIIKKIKETFSPMKKSADQLHKLIVKTEHDQLERPVEALDLVSRALLKYEKIETEKREAFERKKQEELRKAEEERRTRKQEELKRQAAEEAARLKKEAEEEAEELDGEEAARLKKEAEEEAEELKKEAEEKAEELDSQPVIVPQVTLRDKTKKKGIIYRDNWKYKIINRKIFMNWLWDQHSEMLTVDHMAFGKFVKAMKDDIDIPGVEVKNDRIAI